MLHSRRKSNEFLSTPLGSLIALTRNFTEATNLSDTSMPHKMISFPWMTNFSQNQFIKASPFQYLENYT